MLTIRSTFSSHMVLQRDAPLLLEGRSAAVARVHVAFAGHEWQVRASGTGAWEVELPAMPAGGPFELLARSEGESVTLQDVWVGDVWLCSGQSNMEWSVGRSSRDPAARAVEGADQRLRLLLAPKGSAAEPTSKLNAEWRVADATSVRDFSAVGIAFATHLRQIAELNEVRIGLIDCSYGGSEIEGWISEETLACEFAGEGLRESLFGFAPSAFYNAMIAPQEQTRLRGVLWYQGESNAARPTQYARLLPGLIRDWRKTFCDADLPFFVVQLPNYAYLLEGAPFTWLRDAQETAVQKTRNAYLAVTIDTADGHDLHPPEKGKVGRRLALLAARNVYDKDIVASGPVFAGCRADGGCLRLQFENDVGLTTTDGKPVRGFAVDRGRGEFVYVDGSIDGQVVVLPAVDASGDAIRVRYAWEGNPDVNLVNAAGLPAAPFRTDSSLPDSALSPPVLCAAFRSALPSLLG